MLSVRSYVSFLALFLLLQGCEALPSDKIDASGNLSRKDYIALRERGSHNGGNLNELGELSPTPPAQAKPLPSLPPLSTKPELPDKKVSVTLTEDVPLRDVLVELGREADINLEIDPRIKGGLIFTAHDQPFSAVLDRLCKMGGLRVRREGAFIRVELDDPYQESYPVDYLALARRASSEITIATNVFDVDVAGSSGSSSSSGGRSGSGSDNNSIAKISALSEADFWGELDKSLTQILASSGHTQLLSGQGDERAAQGEKKTGRFSIDKQAGLITVYASEAQQDSVAKYLTRLRAKASAQVLIEARIVEVELSDEFQSGVNWSALLNKHLLVNAAFDAATAGTSSLFTATAAGSDFSGVLSLVRTFGATRVLSSPRLTVLNNQTAVLKVARNEVYFVTSAQFPSSVTTSGVTVTGTPVFSSTPRTVPVGLVMTVQPAIDAANGRVTMTLRPTISRVVDRVSDPSIGLNAAQAGITSTVQSKIPVLAVREMDSVVQLKSGEVAVMGGLMQDSSQNQDQGVPPFDALPVVGNLAKSRDNQGATSELVILLRATIMDNPTPDSADADLYLRYNRDPRPLAAKSRKIIQEQDDQDDKPTPSSSEDKE